MQGMIGGIVAVVVGLVLAGLTTVGVVSTVSSAPSQPDQSVMDYGTNRGEARQHEADDDRDDATDHSLHVIVSSSLDRRAR